MRSQKNPIMITGADVLIFFAYYQLLNTIFIFMDYHEADKIIAPKYALKILRLLPPSNIKCVALRSRNTFLHKVTDEIIFAGAA